MKKVNNCNTEYNSCIIKNNKCKHLIFKEHIKSKANSSKDNAKYLTQLTYKYKKM